MCYLGHRAFLPPEHPFRIDKKSFNGEEDHKHAPTPLSATKVLERLCDFNNVFGKGRKKRHQNTEGPWKKRSIFFELPYWATNKLRHNLDECILRKTYVTICLGLYWTYQERQRITLLLIMTCKTWKQKRSFNQ